MDGLRSKLYCTYEWVSVVSERLFSKRFPGVIDNLDHHEDLLAAFPKLLQLLANCFECYDLTKESFQKIKMSVTFLTGVNRLVIEKSYM